MLTDGHLFFCDSKVQTALQDSCSLSNFSLILLTQFTELFPFFTFSNFSETMSFSVRLNCLCCVLHSECNHGQRTLRTQRSTSCLLIDYWAKLAASRCENNAGECISFGQYYILSETRERAYPLVNYSQFYCITYVKHHTRQWFQRQLVDQWSCRQYRNKLLDINEKKTWLHVSSLRASPPRNMITHLGWQSRCFFFICGIDFPTFSPESRSVILTLKIGISVH